MAYIPKDAKWYLAAMVEEITVEGDSRRIVHKNWTLIRGDSPEDAYRKAHELGRKSDVPYENPNGRLVQIKLGVWEKGGTLFFRGKLDERVPGTCEDIEFGSLFNRVMYL